MKQKLTLQKMFDKVWDHFVVKKNPKSTVNGLCQYRGPNNTKCAIGLFIPKSVYRKSMEGKPINRITVENKSVRQIIGDDYSALNGLQQCHDHSISGKKFNKDISELLTVFAQRFSLIIPQKSQTKRKSHA